MEINTDHLSDYLGCLFGQHEWQPDEFLLVRGVGEKGTKQEGVFSEDQALQPALYDTAAPIAGSAARYSQHLIGTFIVPAILNAPKAKEENVKLLPALILDLDEVPGWEAIRWLSEEFAAPSMVIASGGRNQHGPKLHAYYVLDAPLPAPEVIPLAVRLAELSGADAIFMRRTQPIRVPGSVHLKGGEAKPVTLESWNTDTFTAAELTEKMATLGASPWALQKPLTRQGAGVTFSSATSADSNALLTTTVREGGIDGISRFDAFSRVAGHYLHVCRTGAMQPEEAFLAVTGWAEAHLVPSWPAERIAREFAALYNREIAARGPFPESKKYEPIIPAGEEGGLKYWAAHRWVTHPKPEHTFLVDALIIQGEPHLFVAEGGAGKTFQIADLAMKVAAYEEGDELAWCGQEIKSGGTAVLILCEDSKTEMHIRLLELDRDGLIAKAGDRLIVLPMTAIGGAFPLSERDPKTGSATTSQRWSEMIRELKLLPDLALVAIDTLNSVTHGDENSAVVISEMMREAQRVCGELGAALVINHHIRKSEDPIRSLEELRNAIRGSTAIPSYFRINFGMFRASDWERRCKALDIKPHKDAVWRMGVVKANIMGLFDGEKTLIRTGGALEDATDRDPFNRADIGERSAWIILVVGEAAKAGHPFGQGGKNASEGFYKRRQQLPADLARLGYQEIGRAVDAALASKGIVLCAAKTGTAKWLDIPTGRIARNDAGEQLAKGSWQQPDWTRWVYDEAQGVCVSKMEGAGDGRAYTLKLPPSSNN